MAEIASVTTKEKGSVLIVDDVLVNRMVLRNIIASMGYTPVLAEGGKQALELIKEGLPELFLLDISMPEMDGYELAAILKGDVNTRDIPIIFISAIDETEDIVKGFEIGGEDYIIKPFIPAVVKARVGVHLKFAEMHTELVESNRRLQASLSNQLKQIEEEKKGVLYALAGLARANSNYDDSYLDRGVFNCRLLANAMQISGIHTDVMSDSYIDTLLLASPLCNIGNVGIPVEILQKREAGLSSEERTVMQTHTTLGAKILSDLVVNKDYNDFVKMAEEVAHFHHENWDGSGYPEGLKGDEIPLSAQIASIVTVYGALTSSRAYRDPYTKEEAYEIMNAEKGVMFNPVLLELFNKISRQVR